MGGDIKSQQSFPYNLSEQAGVLAALRAVRLSDLSPSEKNELRDEIFTYTKSGGDPRLRELLEARLAEVPVDNTVTQANAKEEPAAPTPGFAGSRPTPSFTVRQPQPHTTPTAEASTPSPAETSTTTTPPEAASQPEPEPKPEPKPIAESEPVAQAQPTTPPTSEAATPAPATSQTTESEPAPRPQTENEAPAPEPKTQTAPETASEPAPAPEQTAPRAASAEPATPHSPTIERIREIKRYINSAVGNPVNLVDIDNTVGRTYMAALLDAMQSVNAETGRAGNKEMAALEEVFAQVQTLLQDQAANESAAPATSSESSAPEPKPVPAPESAQPTSEAATVPDTPATPKPDATEQTSTQSQPAPTDAAPTTEPTAPEPRAASETTSVPINKLTAEPAPLAASKTEPEEESSAPASDTPTQPTSSDSDHAAAAKQSPGASASSEYAHPDHFAPDAIAHESAQALDQADKAPLATDQASGNAEAATPRTTVPPAPKTEPTDAAESTSSNWTKQAAETETSSTDPASTTVAEKMRTLDEQSASLEHATDPLYAPEIDAGLQQLLLEWSIFKSSGLFGTGPNGREHPLYKKLAPLMIQDVASGRFEDARPEIVQSIKDYMNGWRYEQGIVYEPGETFETYLRRVIHFILHGAL